jgi:uncharacterized protein (UPF0264 family)
MTGFLASVRNREEAVTVLESGVVDILDLKNPEEGALGALPADTIREIVGVANAGVTVSATLGDLPMQPECIVFAIEHTARQGVDIVKAGFFGSDGHDACIQAIAPLTKTGIRIVAVMFADQTPDFSLLPKMKAAGFYGVMLDTADKNGKGLVDYLAEDKLRGFLQSAKALGLITGLAGSLKLEDIPALASLGPDYLGFRGALCDGGRRNGTLQKYRLQNAGNLLRECYNIAANAGWA